MGLRCAVFGASGGIGAALVEQLLDRPDVARVYAGSRQGVVAGDPRLMPFVFDLKDEASIVAAAERIGAEGPLDLAIVATGLLQREPDVLPEKSWRAIDSAAMAEVFAVNTIGPSLIAKHVLPLLSQEGTARFAAISARVGSIGDNGLGGWHSYRASKAALNMLIRNFAIELRRRNRGALAVALHPGTVDTALSEPFQGNVPDRQLFTAERSARHLLVVLDGLTPADSGGFFAWDGTAIEW